MADPNTSDDHLPDRGGDLNSALKRWFDLRDVRTYTDIAAPHRDFFAVRTAVDSTRALLTELAGAAGKETTDTTQA